MQTLEPNNQNSLGIWLQRVSKAVDNRGRLVLD